MGAPMAENRDFCFCKDLCSVMDKDIMHKKITQSIQGLVPDRLKKPVAELLIYSQI